MTALRVVMIACDGCADTFESGVAEIADARILACDQGWVTSREGGVVDYCPTCSSPRAERKGDLVVVRHGQRIVGEYLFPAITSPEEWEALSQRVRADAPAVTEDLEAALEFMRVESLVRKAV